MSTNTVSKTLHPGCATRAPEPAAMILGLAVVEALIGRRPLHHLRPRMGSGAFAHLALLVHDGRFKQARIAAWRHQMPTHKAVEMSVTISDGTRWLVCVLRLDAVRQWRCSEFQVLGA